MYIKIQRLENIAENIKQCKVNPRIELFTETLLMDIIFYASKNGLQKEITEDIILTQLANCVTFLSPIGRLFPITSITCTSL